MSSEREQLADLIRAMQGFTDIDGGIKRADPTSKTIASAEHSRDEAERQYRLGSEDSLSDMAYWAAYIDGAMAQLREDLRTQPGLPRQGPGRELEVQMSDYYSRQDILAFLRSYRCSTDAAFHMEGHLSEVPAADVRPVVRGKWVVSRTDYGWNGAEFPTHCKCTECGREVPYQDKDNFCPNCGADMRGGKADV